MLIADQEGGRGLESWDLSVFRLPRPEKLNRTIVYEKVKRLELKFADENGELPSRKDSSSIY